MKKKYTVFGWILLAGFFILFTAGIKYTGGSPGARTGSPGDNSMSCTQCHSGTALNSEDWITSNIPASGYVPGQTYTITLNATHESQKFGFEATVESVGGMKTGQLLITNGNETKLVNNDNAVTHTSGGTVGNNGRTWNFDWVAPAEGSGMVTFYAAVNASNSNSGTSGDVIYLTQMTAEEVNTGLYEIFHPEVTVYPVPAVDYVNIDITNPGAVISINLFSATGALISQETIDAVGKLSHTERILTGHLEPGYYFVDIQMDGNSFTRKIAKL